MSRLIFDTRALNQRFAPAPHTELPSATALCGMEVHGERLVMSSCDVENAFYNFRVPIALARCFRLPPVAARFCGVESVDGAKVAPWQRVQPFLTTLPMGWAWALHLCQSAVQRGVNDILGEHRLLKDKRTGIVVTNGPPADESIRATGTHRDVAAAVYVDNIAIFACCEQKCRATMASVISHLRSIGLPIHEEAQPSSEGAFIGWSLRDNVWSIKSSRMWRLRWSLEEILRRGRATAPLMEVVVGHCTWQIMGLRGSLSIFDSVYEFIKSAGDNWVALPASVRSELSIAAGVLPVLRCDVRSSWSSSVHCYDASPSGIGACIREVDPANVAAVGRHAEAWRFRNQDTTAARASALQQSGLVASMAAKVTPNSRQPVDFEGVPADMMSPPEWTCVLSLRTNVQEHIMRSEGRALSFCAR